LPLQAILRVLRQIARLLFSHPLGARRQNVKIEVGSRTARFIRGVLYRLALAPFLLAITVAALVFAGTHPRVIAGDIDPSSLGIYYDPVTFLSDDNIPLDAWLVPCLDAHRVLQEKDNVLKESRPAVVLVHD